MPLPLIVDSLDSVAEAFRGEYVADGDKFKLAVEGIEDTAGLKSALKKERDQRAALEKKMKSWEASGKTPEEIAELLAKLDEDAAAIARKKGDVDAILKQHQDKAAKREQELLGELDVARKSERGAVVGERLVAALARGGVTEEGTELLPDRLAGRIKFETVDGKRVLKIMQADGETPMAGSGADGVATLDDLVKEAVTKYPSLFKGDGNGGSGKQPDSKAGGAGGVKSKAEFKNEKERAAWVDKNGYPAYAALPDR